MEAVRWCFCCCRFVVYCCPYCGGSVFFTCFVVQCFVCVLVLQSSWWEKENWLLCFVSLVFCDCYCFEVLLHDAVGWPAVCVCVFS